MFGKKGKRSDALHVDAFHRSDSRGQDEGRYHDRALEGGDYVSHQASAGYRDDQIFRPEVDLSTQKYRKEQVVDQYRESIATSENRPENRDELSDEIDPFEHASPVLDTHPEIQSQQNFTPNFDALTGEYKTISEKLDTTFSQWGMVGQILIFFKGLVNAVLYLVLLAAVLMGAVMVVCFQVMMFFFGGLFIGAAGSLNFVMQRFASFVVMTIVAMAAWHYFWKLNPELSLRVDEYTHKVRMFSQQYLGGISLPDITFFDDAVEDTVNDGLRSIGVGQRVDVPNLPDADLAAWQRKLFGQSAPLPELDEATRLLDILPGDVVRHAVPDALLPLIDVAGDPQSVAALSTIVGRVDERNIEKALPILRQTLLNTQSDEVRGAVLESLKQIESPSSRQIIRDYERLVGWSGSRTVRDIERDFIGR